MIKILPDMSASLKTAAAGKTTRPDGMRGDGGGGGATQAAAAVAAPRPVDHSASHRKRRSGEQSESGKKKRLSAGRYRQRRRQRGALSVATAGSSSRLGHVDAPFNSTQFLMSDHLVSGGVDGGAESLERHLETALGPPASRAPSERTETAATAAVAKRKGTRARESSFSLEDSDEDYYYSSPEDEEEFVCQEFIKEYNSQRRCRLVDMSKADLIQEYLQMEQRVDNLTMRLNSKPAASTKKSTDNAQDEAADANTAEQIRHYQWEILRLEAENERLRGANASLIQQKDLGGDKSTRATDSGDDDSDCSTCSSCSSSSSSEEEDSDNTATEKTDLHPAAAAAAASGLQPPTVASDGSVPADKEGSGADKETDTGYESSNSGSNGLKTLKGEATSTSLV